MQLSTEEYIKKSTRPLDRALYLLLTDEGDKQSVVNELKKYQNEDGGFGHGIEPDMQAPVSTPLSTSVALQYVVRSEIVDTDIIEPAIGYLLEAYSESFHGWFGINQEIEEYPHAPWWEYDEKKEQKNWANPTVEIIGYLNHFETYVPDKNLLTTLNKKAQEYLLENEVAEVHDLLCYKRYFELCPDRFSKESKEKLFNSIVDVIESDKTKWNSYVPKPVDFADSPSSPFVDLFSPSLITDNLEFLSDSLVKDHWEPSWDWGVDSGAWTSAKTDWSGILTVKNSLILRAFEL